jgi:hypothetical protein
MYATVAHLQSSQEGTVSSHTMASREYTAAISGALPANQFVLVHCSVLDKYREIINQLEEKTKVDRLFIAELLRGREFLGETEDRWTGPLSTSAATVVNSLLSSVRDSSFQRDEAEDE